MATSELFPVTKYKQYACTGLLIGLVLLDTLLTYWQHTQFVLDGDMAKIVLPTEWCQPVLEDPFGWSALTKGTVYIGANRFFAHAAMYGYWRNMPHLLQYLTDPISSLYTANALFNTATQLLVLLVLAAFVRLGATGARGALSYWLAVGLLVPLFQTQGLLFGQMAIVNQSTTYTFFYAFPIGLLLVLLWPFFRAACRRQPLRLHPLQALALVGLMVVISLNGPIATAAVAVLLLGVGCYWAWWQWPVVLRRPARPGPAGGWLSGQALLLLAVLGALSLYSLNLGRFDAEGVKTLTLTEIYRLLPQGIHWEMGLAWGLPTLLAAVVANAALLWGATAAAPARRQVLAMMGGLGLFTLVFLALIPLGGYRPYRPLVIRYDSILPILLGIFFAFGLSTHYLLHHLRGYLRAAYAASVVGLLGAFAYADFALSPEPNNNCERWSLIQMAYATEPVVRVSPMCYVLSWELQPDYHATEYKAQMLYFWGVTSQPRPFYQ